MLILLRERRLRRKEIADIFIYLINLCHMTNIDVVRVIDDKIEKNRLKYPVDKIKGKNTNVFLGNKA